MTENIKHYQQLVASDILRDKEPNKMFQKIDDMWNGRWELPPGLKDKDYMRAFKTTAPHDAILAAGRVMASKMPTINIQPMSPTFEDGVEQKIESLLDWNLYNIIRRSPNNPLMDISLSAVKFSKVAYQLIYIPFEMKGRTDKRAKAIKRLGDFSFRVHKDPTTVHASYDEYSLNGVSVASCKTAKEISSLYPSIKDKIEAEVRKRMSDKDDLLAMMNKTIFTLYDYTDYDDRVIWVSLNEGCLDETGGDTEIIVIRREPHNIPFLSWVYQEDDHPLMKSVVDADLYANANVLESLRYYLVVATVAQARSWSRTLDGDGVEINHEDPASQVQMKQGEEFGMLPPAQLDPTLNLLIDSVRGDIRQTSVSQALTTLDRLAAGTPFASVNAILQASISSLASIQKIIESSLEDGLHQMLRWMDYSDIPLIGKRRVTKSFNKDTAMMGADLFLKKGDINPDDIYIRVSLNTTTPTDKDAAINRAILMTTQLPYSPEKALDENGVEYTQADMQNYLAWQFAKAELGADVTRISMQPQLEAQQMMQKQQMEQQQAQMEAQQGAEVPQPGFENTQGEAGLSPASAQPGIGREQISNQDMSGAGIA